ncbi:MAG: crossover junction endodeoxyribonuclease RuvC [Ehrlichia sp.]
MKKIIGIDPGLNSTGWAVLSVDRDNKYLVDVVNNGSILTSSKENISKRLYKIHIEFLSVLNTYQVDSASMEEVFINKNPKSSMLLCYARCALILTLSIKGVPLFEYSTNYVKKSITGNGHAEKEQVHFMVEKILNTKFSDLYDISDAVAVALCHVYSK